jgi:hypothetical protein
MKVGDVLAREGHLQVVYRLCGDGEVATVAVKRLDLLRWFETVEGQRALRVLRTERHSVEEFAAWKAADAIIEGWARRFAFGDPHISVIDEHASD